MSPPWKFSQNREISVIPSCLCSTAHRNTPTAFRNLLFDISANKLNIESIVFSSNCNKSSSFELPGFKCKKQSSRIRANESAADHCSNFDGWSKIASISLLVNVSSSRMHSKRILLVSSARKNPVVHNTSSIALFSSWSPIEARGLQRRNSDAK